jgi:AraC-like DNA-binding protein
VNAVISRLLRLHRAVREFPDAWSPDVFAAIETRTNPREYYWDGIKRACTGAAPQEVLFQYTLRGWGHYTEGGVTRRVTPGHAFVAVIPSAHVYCLPPESGEWTFFWIIVRHPYASARLAEARRRTDAIIELGAQDPLLTSAVKLFEGAGLNTFRDEFAREMTIFEFLVEYERFAHGAAGRTHRADRERLMEACRRHVIANLERPIDVSELAAIHQMSRSHFSHHFRGATGLSPGKFITDVRLQEVNRRLVRSRDTLKTIAAQTGFADANHLCKVFRRHYHLSPGSFRKQMR